MILNIIKCSWWCLIISMSLTACAIFSPVQPDCIKEYLIDVKLCAPHASRATYKTMAVAIPHASQMYQSKDMVYSTQPHQYNYFAKNRWATKPSQMLQPLLIQTLQNTGRFKAVAPTAGAGHYDFLLNTQIVDFYQDFCAGRSVFKLTVRAQIVKARSGRIIASKEFAVIEPTPYPSPYGGVIAANQAAAKMLSELARWSSRVTR